MKTLKVLFVTVLAFTMVSTASAQVLPYGAQPHVNVAQMGMGGITTTVATNAHTVFYNPGMLTRQHFALEITVPFGTDASTLDLVDFVNNNKDAFQDFQGMSPDQQEQFMRDSEEFDNKWFGINAGPFFGFSFKNFGLAVYESANMDVKLDQGVLEPKLSVRGYGDMVAALGFGKTMTVMDREIGFGVTARYINRSTIPLRRIKASDAANYQDLGSTMLDDLKNPVTGLGLDLGAVHTLELGEPGSGINMDVAAVMQDLYGSLDGEWIKPNLKVGEMYHMPFAGTAFVRRWDVGIDVVDLFNRQGVSLFQKINMGTELNLLAGLISVRGGFHQGYPTYGLGVRLGIIKLDGAMYTYEQGTAPGQDPKDMLMAQLSFGW